MANNAVANKLNVGNLIYDGLDVLDLGGPFEVFSRTRLAPGPESRKTEDSAPFYPFNVAKSAAPVVLEAGFKVVPDYTFANAPKIDVLVVHGGFGAFDTINDAETIEWIRRTSTAARKVTSVCTGALLLAKAGLLRGHRATTHWAACDSLASIDPTVKVERDVRYVDDEGIISAAGIAAGTDMAFYVVEQLCGRAVADETAHFMQYLRNAVNTKS